MAVETAEETQILRERPSVFRRMYMVYLVIVLLIHDGVMLVCESTSSPRTQRVLPLVEMYSIPRGQ